MGRGRIVTKSMMTQNILALQTMQAALNKIRQLGYQSTNKTLKKSAYLMRNYIYNRIYNSFLPVT